MEIQESKPIKKTLRSQNVKDASPPGPKKSSGVYGETPSFKAKICKEDSSRPSEKEVDEDN